MEVAGRTADAAVKNSDQFVALVFDAPAHRISDGIPLVEFARGETPESTQETDRSVSYRRAHWRLPIREKQGSAFFSVIEQG